MDQQVVWHNHHGICLATKNGAHVIACEDCGFAHVVPLPNPETLIALYREQFYAVDKADYFANAQGDQEWLQATYDDRYATFEQHLPSHRRQILDVGCGPGFFLDAGRERGWSVLGLEPSPAAAKFARERGVDVVEGFFEAAVAATLPPQDVVHLSQVLEHVADPVTVLQRAHNLLSPDGLICVSVPNDFNPLQAAVMELTADGAAPWWVAPDHHLNYFNFTSLAGLLERAGFVEIHREASFPLEMFALMGENYVAEPELGPVIHAKRKAFEMNLERAGGKAVKREFFGALAAAGLGRLAVITARRI